MFLIARARLAALGDHPDPVVVSSVVACLEALDVHESMLQEAVDRVLDERRNSARLTDALVSAVQLISARTGVPEADITVALGLAPGRVPATGAALLALIDGDSAREGQGSLPEPTAPDADEPDADLAI
jgi:hypothetical protein